MSSGEFLEICGIEMTRHAWQFIRTLVLSNNKWLSEISKFNDFSGIIQPYSFESWFMVRMHFETSWTWICRHCSWQKSCAWMHFTRSNGVEVGNNEIVVDEYSLLVYYILQNEKMLCYANIYVKWGLCSLFAAKRSNQ